MRLFTQCKSLYPSAMVSGGILPPGAVFLHNTLPSQPQGTFYHPSLPSLASWQPWVGSGWSFSPAPGRQKGAECTENVQVLGRRRKRDVGLEAAKAVQGGGKNKTTCVQRHWELVSTHYPEPSPKSNG